MKANESSFKFISQNIAQIKLDMLKLEEETDNSLQNIKGLMISLKISISHLNLDSINSVWESLGLMGNYIHKNDKKTKKT